MNQEAQTAEPPREPGNRILGTFVAPEETFRAIARRPTWLLPILLWTGMVIAVTGIMTPRLDMEALVRKQMSASGRDVSQEQVAQGVERAQSMKWIFAGPYVILPAIVSLLLTLIFWAGYRAFGSEISYKQAYAVTVHAFLPQVLAGLLLIPFLLRFDKIEDPQAAANALKSNLGALVDPVVHPLLAAFLSSFDLFAIWTLVLLIIGYSIAAQARKSRSAIFFVSLWALYILGKVGLTSLRH
jgi:Yip1 domain